MSELAVREIAHASAEYRQALALRDDILRRPIGLRLADEDLSDEAQQVHIGVFGGEALLGVLVLKPLGADTFVMRQVAVQNEAQGKGVGRRMVAFAEDAARARGRTRMVLHARKTAVPFYLRLGYSVTSEEFEEVGIAHFEMEKALSHPKGADSMITRACERLTLNDQNTMPGFGLGCYKTVVGDETYHAVRAALDAGYRMIDTATLYHNEHDVGRAVRDSGIPREEIFVVSKIWPLDYSTPEKGIDFSLKTLDIGYIDLYLLHWPHVDTALRYKAWEALLKTREKGDFRSVGVSNFMADQLCDLIGKFSVVPAVNQIELHPWHQQREACDCCRENGVAVMGWSPLARGGIEDAVITSLAQKYARTAAQIILRWHLQKQFILIPKSSRAERIRENSALFDFALTPQDMQRIDALDCGKGVGRNDPYTFDGVIK